MVLIGRQRFVRILVKDAEALLAREHGVSRRLHGANTWLYGTPILISGSVLGASLDELLLKISERLAAYRGST
jgi:hypothetical protein